MTNRAALIAGFVGALVGGLAVALGAGLLTEDGGGDRAGTERIVRAYILEHPEIIPEAMDRLAARESGKAVAANRAAFETPYGTAWAGAADGDVVLVEFFDYACGFCRKSNADIERLLAEDDKLKVVWRELPVLGQDSVNAAQVSLAAARQGKFKSFYAKLFEASRPNPAAIEAAARATGVNPAPAPDEARAELEKNYELARTINASGTPTFVVGDQVLQGAVGYEALKQAIAQARARS